MTNKRLIPISIIVAGLIVSGSILQSSDLSLNFFDRNEKSQEVTGISPISPEEPILGNPEADIIIVEYSDTECSFCISFARERDRIMSFYGESGMVAWVYRTLPVLNSVSKKKAMALECVAEEHNDHVFWEYLRMIQETDITDPKNGGTDTELLKQPLKKIGVSTEFLSNCIEDERYKNKVQRNIQEAVASGAERTPFLIILLPERLSSSQEERIKETVRDIPADLVLIPSNSDRLLINGSVPAEIIKEVLNAILLH